MVLRIFQKFSIFLKALKFVLTQNNSIIFFDHWNFYPRKQCMKWMQLFFIWWELQQFRCAKNEYDDISYRFIAYMLPVTLCITIASFPSHFSASSSSSFSSSSSSLVVSHSLTYIHTYIHTWTERETTQYS